MSCKKTPAQQKIVGKVPPSKKDYYCSAGSITTNRVSYGVTKTVSTKEKKLVKARSKCIKNTVAGRDIQFQCTPCNERQACPSDYENVKVLLDNDPVRCITNPSQSCCKD